MPSVLVTGSRRPQALETSYARAFGELGWTVGTWDAAAAGEASSRGGRAGRLFARFVQVEPWRRKANVELLQRVDALRPDLLLVIATDGLRGGTLAQAKVLNPAMRIIAAYPDSAHSLDAERIACLAGCDHVAVSAPAWIPAFERLCRVPVSYLPFAADTHLYSPAGPPPGSPEWDVGFVGTWRHERETLLAAMHPFRTRVWGNAYWKSRTAPGSPVRGMWAGGELVGGDFSAACAGTAVMLNILDPITWPGPNMRSFELPACGAFVLSSRSDAILEIFTEGESIECFGDAAEACEKVRHYLDRPEERARIARKAHEVVIHGGHTYLDRARAIAALAER